MRDADTLAGRRALVTGAGSGIGRAIALELAAAGADVAVLGRRTEPLARTVELARAAGGKARAVAGDVADPALAKKLERELGALDVIVHAALRFPPYGALEELSGDAWDGVLDVAVRGPARLTAAFLGGMKERGFGRVVFLGSVAASAGAARQAPYAAAKAALHGLAKSVALEGAARGVTCNVVEPGLVLTERVLEKIPEATRRALIAATPARRAGEAAEVAALVAFLCSPRAGYLTGAVIPVSGGLGLGLSHAPGDEA